MARPRRRRPIARLLVRAAAGGALAGAVALPLLRKRLRLPRAATAAAAFAGPLALAVLEPRTDRRDIALYALQMWAFTVVHELPYDDPDRLRERLRIRYPIKADRLIGGGQLPNARLQRVFGLRDGVSALDRFPIAARQMAATYDLGCAVYFAVPTAPPWWASENGYTDEHVERRMVPVGEDVWGEAWPPLYRMFGGNPWAAMPSLHFGTALLAALLLAETGKGPGLAGAAYAAVLGFSLVYLGEHYVADLAAGAALVVAVRRGEPLAEPLVWAVNRRLQAFERAANPGSA